MIMGFHNVHQHQTGKNKLLSATKPEKPSCYLLATTNQTGKNKLLSLKGASTL